MPDLVDDVRREVTARRPVDERERTSIEQLLAALPALAAPFDEHADPVHLTASAIVIGRRGVILHRHKRLAMWLQPGGHIDPGETPWDAARREAWEETGLQVEFGPLGTQLVHVDVHAGPRGHTHLDLRYLLLAGDEEPRPPEGESQDVRWFDWDEAISMSDDGLRGALVALRPEGTTP